MSVQPIWSGFDRVNFFVEFSQFPTDVGAVISAVGVVGALNCKLTHPLKDVVDFVMSTFDGVDHRLRIGGIAGCHVKAASLGGQARRDGQTSRVISL